MLTEDDKPESRPPGYVYKPAELRIADLHLNDIHIRQNVEGRTEVYVMANYSNQQNIRIWEDNSFIKAGKWWCHLAEAVCCWLNLPLEERKARRKR